jgi:hypothetical protein
MERRGFALRLRDVAHQTEGEGNREDSPKGAAMQISQESKHVSECAPLLAKRFPSQASLHQTSS